MSDRNQTWLGIGITRTLKILNIHIKASRNCTAEKLSYKLVKQSSRYKYYCQRVDISKFYKRPFQDEDHRIGHNFKTVFKILQKYFGLFHLMHLAIRVKIQPILRWSEGTLLRIGWVGMTHSSELKNKFCQITRWLVRQPDKAFNEQQKKVLYLLKTTFWGILLLLRNRNWILVSAEEILSTEWRLHSGTWLIQIENGHSWPASNRSSSNI